MRRIARKPYEALDHRDGRLFWLTEASAVLMTDELATLDVNAVSRQERQSAFERLQVPPAVSLTVATCMRNGRVREAIDPASADAARLLHRLDAR